MIKKETKKSFFGGPPTPYFEESETGRKYRRIYGGMAWPSVHPGFAIIVGEELEVDKSIGKHKCRVIAEYEHNRPSALIQRCQEFKSIFKVDSIYGDTSNTPMMEFIRGSAFHLLGAPFADAATAIQFYSSLIREVTTSTDKLLTFGPSSKLPGYLASLSPDRFQDYPAALALGYALSALKAYSYVNSNKYLQVIMPEHEPSY